MSLTNHPELRLFPLGTVLFPDGPLPLRIFEPRYLDLVSACLRNDEPFGVCLIRSGREVGRAASPFAVGTLAKIVDWHRYDDGVLGIVAVGTRRFRVHETRTQPDQLLVGRLEVFDEPEVALPPDASDLLGLVDRLLAPVAAHYTHVPARRADAGWVGYRLAELLPLPMTRKQHLLELEAPLARLDELRRILRAIELARGTSPAAPPGSSDSSDEEP